MIHAELLEKLVKLLEILIEDMDSDHIGLVLSEAGIKWNELESFLNLRQT